MQTSESYSNNLLIVDDDPNILKLLRKILESTYYVQACRDGHDAIKLLEDGYVPTVIISDQLLPDISGSQILARSMEFSPHAGRIMLTGHSDPQEIMQSVNQAHALLYITKPFKELEIRQSVKLAYQHYKSELSKSKLAVTQQKLAQATSILNEKNKQLSHDYIKFFNDTLNLVAFLSERSERLFFNSHFHFVQLVAYNLAEKLNVREEVLFNLKNALKLHSAYLIGMRERISLIDPLDITDEQDLFYFLTHFTNTYATLARTGPLEKYAHIASQVFENFKGNGLPKGVRGQSYTKEACIISIPKVYHNMVYRLEADNLSTLFAEGQFKQSAERTLERHNRAVEFLNDKESWYYVDVLKQFLEMVDDHSYEPLKPIKEEMVINLNG